MNLPLSSEWGLGDHDPYTSLLADDSWLFAGEPEEWREPGVRMPPTELSIGRPTSNITLHPPTSLLTSPAAYEPTAFTTPSKPPTHPAANDTGMLMMSPAPDYVTTPFLPSAPANFPPDSPFMGSLPFLSTISVPPSRGFLQHLPRLAIPFGRDAPSNYAPGWDESSSASTSTLSSPLSATSCSTGPANTPITQNHPYTWPSVLQDNTYDPIQPTAGDKAKVPKRRGSRQSSGATGTDSKPAFSKSSPGSFRSQIGSTSITLAMKKFRKSSGGSYPCTVCERDFTSKVNLRGHIDAHYGIKRHICKWCGEGFSWPNMVKRHEARCPKKGAEPAEP